MKSNDRAVNNRLDHIDILKGITILLVVVGHFYPNNSPRLWSLLRDIIYSFHMPLFMIISGYLYAYSSRIQSFNDYLKFISKKFRRLGIPYLTISAFVLFVKFVMGKFIKLEHPISPNWLWHLFLNPMGGYATFLWFIYTLFLIFLIYPLVTIKFKNSICLVGLFLILYFLRVPEVFCLNFVVKFLFYFYFGILIFHNPIAISRKPFIFIITSIVFLTVFLFRKELLTNQVYIKKAYDLILALTGSFALWVLVFSRGTLTKKLLKPFLVLGTYSAPIYLLHTTAMAPVKILFLNLCMGSTSGFYISAYCTILMGILMPILFTEFFLYKNRKLSLIFLGVEPIK